MNNYEIIKKDGRYVITLKDETIVDDCNGHGYLTKESAQKAFDFTHRAEMKDEIKEKTLKFLKKNPALKKTLLQYKETLEKIGEKLSVEEIKSTMGILGIKDCPVEYRDIKEALNE